MMMKGGRVSKGGTPKVKRSWQGRGILGNKRVDVESCNVQEGHVWSVCANVGGGRG